MDGLEAVEIKLSELEFTSRIDAEYYKKKYLEYEFEIRKSPHRILKDVTKFVIGPFGSAFKTYNYEEDSGHRYIRGQDVKPFVLQESDNKYIPKDDFERLKKYALKEKDVLVSVVGTLGNACIIQKKDLPAIFSCKSTVLRANEINPVYLLTYLNCKQGKSLLLRKERGAVQKGLNLDDLKTLLINIPSDVFQNQVEIIFDKAQSKLDSSKSYYNEAETLLLNKLGLHLWHQTQANTEIKSFKNSFLQSGRLDAEYYQPKYDKIEEKVSKYGSFKLKEVFDVLSNPSPSFYTEKGIKVIKTKNLRIPTITINSIQDHTKQECLKVRKNDLLFASMGVGSLGRLSFIEKELVDYTIDGTIRVFRAKKEFKNSFIEIPTLLFLTSSFGQNLIYKYVIGSTGIISISKENVENLIIPKVNDEISKILTSKVLESVKLKQQSQQLLEAAKQAVEIAIEEGEDKAMEFITTIKTL